MNSTSAHKFRRSLLFALKLLSFAFCLTTYGLVWFFFYGETTYGSRGNYIVILLYGAILLTFNNIYGVYKFGQVRLGDLVGSGALSLLFTNTFTYFQLCLIAKEMLDVVPLICCTILQMILILVMSFVSHRCYYRLYPRREVLAIVSEYYMNRPLLRKFALDPKKYALSEVISAKTELNEVYQYINKCSAVLLCDVEGSVRDAILNYCFATDHRVYVMPSLSDILINSAHTMQMDDTPIFLCKNRGLSTEQRIIKRTMDIVGSLFGIIVFGLVFIVQAVAIKLYDRGPVFFRQTRVTENDRTFEILKFRSMVVDAEKDGREFCVDNDSRITPIGKITRKTRMDELPQLFNILKGDMSIVGPRPERVENDEEYRTFLPDFGLRHKVRTGLTGYAQVYGKYNTTAKDKLYMDLIYIQNFSIISDIRLILMTIKIIFKRESTDGMDDEFMEMLATGNQEQAQKTEE